MSGSFRRKDQQYAEELFRRAAQQENNSPIGSETRRDVLVDRYGNLEPIKLETTRIIQDENGIPLAITERVGRELHCGHIVTSVDQVLGICKYGHIVCIRDQLFTCGHCGAKLCELDAELLPGGSVVCFSHLAGGEPVGFFKGLIRALLGL